VLALSALVGCGHRPPQGEGDASAERELFVAAAANVSDVLNEIGKAFEAQSRTRVTFSFAATGALAKQIENGAPFDLFVSADVSTIDRLIRAGLLSSETKRVYARGRLVLWTRSGSGIKLAQLSDLARPEVRKIALANPELAPYGRAAMEALTASGLLDQVRGKLVYGENVNQALQYAASGNAEAAFIPFSLTRRSQGEFIEVDGRLHQPIDQALAVIGASPRAETARRFADFIAGAEGRRLLEKYGYTVP